MPLFFLLSGYLHKNRSPYDLFLKTSRRLLIPFIFFLILGYLYFVVSSANPRVDVIRGTLSGIVFGKTIVANEILWFILTLFIVRNLGNLFIIHPIISCVPLIILFVVFYLLDGNWFYMGSALMAVPFYLCGHYAKHAIYSVSTSPYRVCFAFIFCGASVLLTLLNGKVSMMTTVYGNTGHGLLDIVLFYLNGVVGSLSILCIASCIPTTCHLINLIADSAISIVGLQYIPLLIWIKHVGFNQNFFLSLLFTLFILAGCLLFDRIVRKKAKWLLGAR